MSSIDYWAHWYQGQKRTAWQPVWGESGRSQFGGTPQVQPQAPWPHCGSCNHPMTLFAQLHSDDLPQQMPAALRWQGLLQVWCCTNETPEPCDTWRPFANTHQVRVLEGVTEPQSCPSAESFPVRFIERWQVVTDYPRLEECLLLPEGPPESVLEDLEAAIQSWPTLAGEKLGGWPFWIQGVEYPSCPECGKHMYVVLQIDSLKGVPWMWGDMGVAHVTHCRHHPHQWTMSWACY